MEIVWYGQACFRIREMGVTVIADPFDQDSKHVLPRIRADVVTYSCAMGAGLKPRGIRGSPLIFQTPGEYEVGGVFITAVPIFCRQDKEQSPSIAFLYDFGGLTVCHLGRPGCILAQSQGEALGSVNVLLLSIDGESTLSIEQAGEVVGLLEPNIVIPMHYRPVELAHRPGPLARFLKAMNASETSALPGFKIRAGHLPEGMQVVLLACKQ